ncbi:MAG: hypothetical protein ACPKQO_03740 [Nitrososphaeraceae archaeon]
MEIELLQILIIVVFFIFGFLISQLIKKIKYSNQKEQEITNENINEKEYSDIVDTLLTQYTEKLKHIEEKIINFQLKLDIIDSKIKKDNSDIQNEQTKKEIESQYHIISNDMISHKLESPRIYKTRKEPDEKLVEPTIVHILKMLIEKPLTSNEIKNSIGKTREHTSRLMKKLHDEKLVERNTGNKPFKYKLTKLGEQYIQK